MNPSILDKLRGWELLEHDPDLEPGSIQLLLFHAEHLYPEYEPNTLIPFLHRLEKWLDNADSEADQKSLVSLLSSLFFSGRNEFKSLYRTAFSNICRWIVAQEKIDISSDVYEKILRKGLGETWICPITDSMRINGFLKVNGFSGHDHRPHWRSLAEFGDVGKLHKFVADNSIKRLVLLEDFVGSGSQIEDAISFACKEFPNLEVLLCPLIICPKGDGMAHTQVSKYANLTYESALVLPEEIFVTEMPIAGESAAVTRARDLTLKLGHKMHTHVSEHFGYRKTGAMIVLYTNCPDNTLPIFRDEGAKWRPLFPRVWRPE